MSSRISPWLLLALLPFYFLVPSFSRRKKIINPSSERVIILGASQGIGSAIAFQYATRGAKVMVFGRNGETLEPVRAECERLGASLAVKLVGDFCEIDDLIKAREFLLKEWGGLDTLVVNAGVSALQPLLAIAGSDSPRIGIERAQNVAQAAIRGNYLGPLLSAVTFIPMLERSSRKPAIVLISSLASVIPAPTRTVYGSTKAASLILYQSLSIEHPSINFTLVIPSTVEGNFRASAVDNGPIRESLSGVLKKEYVAELSIKGVDNSQKVVWLPYSSRFAHALFWVWPSLVEWVARRKYNFP